jgi:hypothetical protein
MRRSAGSRWLDKRPKDCTYSRSWTGCDPPAWVTSQWTGSSAAFGSEMTGAAATPALGPAADMIFRPGEQRPDTSGLGKAVRPMSDVFSIELGRAPADAMEVEMAFTGCLPGRRGRARPLVSELDLDPHHSRPRRQDDLPPKHARRPPPRRLGLPPLPARLGPPRALPPPAGAPRPVHPAADVVRRPGLGRCASLAHPPLL